MHDLSLSNLEGIIDDMGKNDDEKLQDIMTTLSESLDDTNMKAVPTLKVALYGVKVIMYPTMLWEHTPDLLDLFSLSELYRRRIVSNCLEALQWNRFYTTEGAPESVDGTPLSKEDTRLLERVLGKAQNPDLRESYRNIVLHICASHICHLRQSNQTLLIPVFFMRYFPSPEDIEAEDESSHYPVWLRGLSTTELSRLKAIRLRLIKTLEDMQVREDEGKSNKGVNEFPLEWSQVTGFLCRHIGKIQKLVSDFGSIFGAG